MYSGYRDNRDLPVVKVNDNPLNPCFHLKRHRTDGFDWPSGTKLSLRSDDAGSEGFFSPLGTILRRQETSEFEEVGEDGDGAAQLALAILMDYTNDTDTALCFYQAFKAQVVAHFRHDAFRVSGERIEKFFDIIRELLD